MYKIDIDYFKNIDTPEKAYWLGFIAADGCIYKDRLSIELGIIDENHLYKFLKSIKSNHIIYYRERKNTRTCRIEINNKKFTSNLKKYGIIQNKTYNLIFPKINKCFYKDYIRGFFDGDGTYVFYFKEEKRKDRNNKIYNRMHCEISCVCKCKDFLNTIFQVLKANDIESSLCYDKMSDLYYLRLYGIKKSQTFINFIYYSNCLVLERKRIKILQISKYCLA